MERNFSYRNNTTETTYCDGVVRYMPGIGFQVEAYGGEISVTCHLSFMQSGRIDAVLVRAIADGFLTTQQAQRQPKQGLSTWYYELSKQVANLLLSEHCDDKSIESAAVAIQEVAERGEDEEMKRRPGELVRYGGWVWQALRRA